MRTLLAVLSLSVLPFVAPADWRSAPPADWQVMFNGKNLDGWTMKFAHHEVGDNYADTFRVENGVLRVMYDKYDDFGVALRPPVLQEEAVALRAGARIPLLRRAGEGRAQLRQVEQRRDGALAGAGVDPQGAGLADLGRGAVPGRRSHDDERLHAGHRDLHERADGEGALHQLVVAQVRRRRLDRGGSGSARRRVDPPPDRRQGRCSSSRSRRSAAASPTAGIRPSRRTARS